MYDTENTKIVTLLVLSMVSA